MSEVHGARGDRITAGEGGPADNFFFCMPTCAGRGRAGVRLHCCNMSRPVQSSEAAPGPILQLLAT